MARGAALVLFVGVCFAIDAVRHTVMAVRGGPAEPGFLPGALAAAGNLGVVVLLLIFRGSASTGQSPSRRHPHLGTAFNIAAAPAFSGREADDTVIADLGLTDDPRMAKVGTRMQVEEQERVLLDVAWLAAFVGTLFAIHIGRMGLDQTTFGLLSPAVAVVGDLAVALVIAYAIVVPLKLAFRKATREPGATRLAMVAGVRPGGARSTMGHTLRCSGGSSRGCASRFVCGSRATACRRRSGRGLQIGVPFAAIIVATIPVFGHELVFRYRELGRRASGTRGPSRGPISGAQQW